MLGSVFHREDNKEEGEMYEGPSGTEFILGLTHTIILSHIHYYTLSHTLLLSLTYTTILSYIHYYTLSHTLLFSLTYTTILSHIHDYTLSYLHVKGV